MNSWGYHPGWGIYIHSEDAKVIIENDFFNQITRRYNWSRRDENTPCQYDNEKLY
jgi:hypothetical protein